MFHSVKNLIAQILALLIIVGAGAYAGDITGTGWSQGDVVRLLDNIANYSANHVLDNNPNITPSATTTGDIQTQATFNYTVAGVIYTETPAESTPNLSAAAQPTGNIARYAVTIDEDGLYHLVKGINATTTVNAVLPAVTSDECLIGHVIVNNYSDGAAWTWGTSSFSASSMNATFVDEIVPQTGTSKISLKGLNPKNN